MLFSGVSRLAVSLRASDSSLLGNTIQLQVKSCDDLDPDDRHSIYQDTSKQALQARGVQFLSCHTALEEQARVLVRRNQLSQPPEAIVRDMLAHTEPGVLVVAAMGAAIAVLQAEGHYAYIKT